MKKELYASNLERRKIFNRICEERQKLERKTRIKYYSKLMNRNNILIKKIIQLTSNIIKLKMKGLIQIKYKNRNRNRNQLEGYSTLKL